LKLYIAFIPQSKIYIEDEYYKNLEIPFQLTIRPDIIEIGIRAFEGSSINSIEFSEGLEKIRSYAFSECDRLRSVKLPNSVYEIEDSAFSKCQNLNECILPSNLLTIQKFILTLVL